MTKKAESVFEKHKKGLTTAGAGIGAAALTYAGFRGRLGPISKMLGSSPVKKAPTFLYEGSPITSKATKFKEWLAHGDFKLMSTTEARRAKKPLTGKVYYEGEQAALKGISFDPKATKWNTDKNLIEGVFQDKAVFGKIKDPSIAPTKTMAEFLGGRKYKSEKQLAKAITGRKGDWYIKPRKDYASGAEGHMTSSELREAMQNKRLPKELKDVRKNPKQYIIQEEMKFNPAKEHRTHVAITDAVVKPVGLQTKRHEYGIGVGKNWVTPKQTADAVQRMINRNPKLKSKLKGKNLLFGADVIRDTKGEFKIIEMNDQSGFTSSPTVGHGIYKAVTGADTRAVSGLKGLGVGGAVAGGTALTQKGKKNKAG